MKCECGFEMDNRYYICENCGRPIIAYRKEPELLRRSIYSEGGSEDRKSLHYSEEPSPRTPLRMVRG